MASLAESRVCSVLLWNNLILVSIYKLISFCSGDSVINLMLSVVLHRKKVTVTLMSYYIMNKL